MLMRSQRARNSAETSSVSCCGGLPAASAARCIFWPCSSGAVGELGSKPILRLAPAVFVFGGVAGDGAVAAGDFDAHVTEAGGDGGPFAGEDLALLFAAADAQRGGFGEDDFG